LLIAAGSAAAFLGCAQIIGASFDGVTLGGDASGDDVGFEAGRGEGAILFDDFRDFEPIALGDLELWLSADNGVVESGPDASDKIDGEAVAAPANGVASWADRSGKGHQVKPVEESGRPVLSRDGGMNGRPSVVFDRARRNCLGVTWSALATPKGVTLFVVERGDAENLLRFGAGGTIAFPWNAAGGVADAQALDLRLLVSSAPGKMETPRTGSDGRSWEVLAARLHAGFGGLETFRNGKPVERASLLESDLPLLGSLNVGCAAGGPSAAADVAEILVFTRALEDIDLRNTDGYLRSRWSIPATP